MLFVVVVAAAVLKSYMQIHLLAPTHTHTRPRVMSGYNNSNSVVKSNKFDRKEIQMKKQTQRSTVDHKEITHHLFVSPMNTEWEMR